MALITCPHCGKSISDQAPACIHCGRPAGKPSESPEEFTCPDCGRYVSLKATACMNCGKPLDRVEGLPPPAPSRSYAPLRYAGFWKRLAAFIIDCAILLLGLTFAFLIPGAVMGSMGVDVETMLIQASIWVLALLWFYFTVMETSRAQGTIGKIALRIKVVDKNGNPLALAGPRDVLSEKPFRHSFLELVF